jgi:hypothetical protein
MIIKTFDNGWGSEYPAKQLETQLLTPWYNQLNQCSKRVVVINSVWYTSDYHQTTVLPYLKNNQIDLIVLVAMLDAAIPRVEWFESYATVATIGYYPGAGFVDYWALFLKRNFHSPGLMPLMRVDTIDTAYMCLNRKPHWHRVRLYRELENRRLLDLGLVSMGGDNSPPVRTILETVDVVNLAPNSGTDQNGIANDISSLGTIENWQRCFLNIVTETVYDIDRNHFVSEKIYKPILGLRPFLVYDPSGACAWLGNCGLETFVNDFLDISDLSLSDGNNIPDFLEILCQQPRQYWQHKLLSFNEKILHNKNQLLIYMQQQQQHLKNTFYAL